MQDAHTHSDGRTVVAAAAFCVAQSGGSPHSPGRVRRLEASLAEVRQRLRDPHWSGFSLSGAARPSASGAGAGAGGLPRAEELVPVLLDGCTLMRKSSKGRAEVFLTVSSSDHSAVQVWLSYRVLAVRAARLSTT